MSAPARGMTAAGHRRPPAGTRIRVIWNPRSGQKGGFPTNLVTREQLLDVLARHGLGDDLAETQSSEEAKQLTRAAVRDGYDIVIGAGGDGTIGTIAAELLFQPTALGILPLGSVMNIARMLGVPRDIEAAAELIATGSARAIDTGEAKGVPFFESGSVGMNAAMFREAQRFDRGDWLSILRTIWVAIRYRPARMEIKLDEGIVLTRALMVTVSNGPYTGVAMTVAPDARLDDGRFDVRVFRRFSKMQLLRHLASIAFGRRRYSPEVATYRSSRVRIASRHPLPCRADSKDLGTTPVEFVTRAASLRVIAPPEGTAGQSDADR